MIQTHTLKRKWNVEWSTGKGRWAWSGTQITKILFSPLFFLCQEFLQYNRNGESTWLSSISPLDPFSCQLLKGKSKCSLGRQVEQQKCAGMVLRSQWERAGLQDWVITKVGYKMIQVGGWTLQNNFYVSRKEKKKKVKSNILLQTYSRHGSAKRYQQSRHVAYIIRRGFIHTDLLQQNCLIHS